MPNTPKNKKLFIESTVNSTVIEFDAKTKTLSMKGRSLPENAHKFFIPVFDWATEYLKSNPTKTIIDISFLYLHTGAGRQVYEIIKLLKESEKKGNAITVNWYYQEEDEDMKQVGIDFAAVLKMKFNFPMMED